MLFFYLEKKQYKRLFSKGIFRTTNKLGVWYNKRTRFSLRKRMYWVIPANIATALETQVPDE